MWTICTHCGAIVAETALHAKTHRKPPRKPRPTPTRPRLEPHHGH